MIPWQRTVGISLGLVVASSLWTGARADSTQETVETVPLIQVDDTQINESQVGPAIDDLTATELPTETMVLSPETGVIPAISPETGATSTAAEALAVEVTPVPTDVLANLSQAQLEAIAAIISTAATAPASTGPVANLPAEVVARLDRLPGLEQPVGRRRWLPTSLVRRLRLPQAIASLVRQPRNTALVMLGNHIVVVNPLTGAVLGAVRSVL